MSQFFNHPYMPLSEWNYQQSQSHRELELITQLQLQQFKKQTQQAHSNLNERLSREVEEKEFNNHLLLLEDVC